MDEFVFHLNPDIQVYSDDDKPFKAKKLKDGRYLVSWEDSFGLTNSVIFTNEDVIEAIAEEHWIVELNKGKE